MGETNPNTAPHSVSVHQILGGGAVADVLLWKKWHGGVLMLASSTALWVLFEHCGYNMLSFVANVLLLLVAIMFFWAKSASLLNRPLPPLPNLEVSEELSVKASEIVREKINYGLSFAHDIAIGRNVTLFLQVALSLLIASYIGSLFNFLTLVYMEVLLSLSVPFVYDKFQEQIDQKLKITHNVVQTQYKKIDESVLRRIPKSLIGEKKTQ